MLLFCAIFTTFAVLRFAIQYHRTLLTEVDNKFLLCAFLASIEWAMFFCK